MATERLIGRVVGADGKAATIQIGTVTTVAATEQASVENTGSAQAAVLNFKIPKGKDGAAGQSITGPAGAAGQKGDKGDKGDAATIEIKNIYMVDSVDDVRVVNNGTNKDASYDLYLYAGSDNTLVDASFIEDSTNAVQSNVIQEALAEKADAIDIPTKVSDLENDRNFISDNGVDLKIEDALKDASLAANPVDDKLSDTSENALQNKVIASELGTKAEMVVEDALDDNQTKYGEKVTLRNKDDEVSLVLTGQNIESAVMYRNIAEREPVIVSELPQEGEINKLYLVPIEGDTGDNYSMHIWMMIGDTYKYAHISGGGVNDDIDLSRYALASALNSYAEKSNAIKNITRSGTTFTATRADNTTFTFTQQNNEISVKIITKEFEITGNETAVYNLGNLNAVGIVGYALNATSLSVDYIYANKGYILMRVYNRGNGNIKNAAIDIFYI